MEVWKFNAEACLERGETEGRIRKQSREMGHSSAGGLFMLTRARVYTPRANQVQAQLHVGFSSGRDLNASFRMYDLGLSYHHKLVTQNRLYCFSDVLLIVYAA